MKLWAICFVLIALIDFVWIGILAKPFYMQQLAPIARIEDGKFNVLLPAAIAVYLVLTIAIMFFALPRIEVGAPWYIALAVGAVLGFVLYATYDFTNLATLKDWTLPMTFVDMAWGTVLCGVVTLAMSRIRELV